MLMVAPSAALTDLVPPLIPVMDPVVAVECLRVPTTVRVLVVVYMAAADILAALLLTPTVVVVELMESLLYKHHTDQTDLR